jgi:CRP-like cAMP-binding protein
MTKNKSMIEDLFNKGVRQTYKKDEVIVNAFEEPSGVYLIEKGHIKSYSITDRGDVNIQLIRASGDIFPLLWALGKHNRDIYFAAMDDVTVCRISASEFAAKIEGDDYLQREMTERLIDVYMLLSERVRNLEQRRAKDRLVYCLESLAGRFGKKVGNKTIVQAPPYTTMILPI